jgi:hypothetical protein
LNLLDSFDVRFILMFPQPYFVFGIIHIGMQSHDAYSNLRFLSKSLYFVAIMLFILSSFHHVFQRVIPPFDIVINYKAVGRRFVNTCNYPEQCSS